MAQFGRDRHHRRGIGGMVDAIAQGSIRLHLDHKGVEL